MSIGGHERKTGARCAAILGLPVSRRRCLNHAAEGETLCKVHVEDWNERAAIKTYLAHDVYATKEQAESAAMKEMTS